MLPKINRLTKKRDIERVFNNGKAFKEGNLFLKTLKNNLDISRFVFIVGKKTSTKAVLRNKIRRKLREVVRLNLGQLEKGLDIVFIANKELKEKDFQELQEIVLTAAKKAKIITTNKND